MEIVREIVAVVAQHKWKVYQMDVKSFFLNAVLKEEVYVAQPPGYEVEGQEDKVYWLRRALYGLKQAPHTWYNMIHVYLLDNGFNKCDSEPTLYIKESEGKILIVISYVDDLIFTSSDDFLIIAFKQVMNSEFEIIDLGLLRYFLGIEVKQTENFIFISQAKYVADIWKATSDFRLVGYTNSDWASNVDVRKSTSGYVFNLGSRAIAWASKKLPIVSLSTTEPEYVAAITVTCHAVWMRRMLRDLHHDQEEATTIFCDNTLAIALSKNFVFHKRTKHIDTKYHFIRELVNNDEIVL
eukprot:PITA_04637